MKSSVTKKHDILKATIKAPIFSALRRFTLQFLVSRKVSQKTYTTTSNFEHRKKLPRHFLNVDFCEN